MAPLGMAIGSELQTTVGVRQFGGSVTAAEPIPLLADPLDIIGTY